MGFLESNYDQKQNSTPVWIDTDNALGSPFGDIDDAIALATLFKSNYPIYAVSNVFGNTFQSLSYQQTHILLQLLNSKVPHYSGACNWWSRSSIASQKLAQVNTKIKILALGPLTNIAEALKLNPNLKNNIEEIIFVGTNYQYPLPNWRFFDFNIFKDKTSALEVLQSGVRITLIPCDQARKLRLTAKQVSHFNGPVGDYIYQNSKRWFRRARLLKLQKSIPVWDLTAVLYLLQPAEFSFVPAKLNLSFLNYIQIKKTPLDSQIKTLSSFNQCVESVALKIMNSTISA
jgi:inosine-uridine nucleoside N-ribohydrolase